MAGTEDLRDMVLSFKIAELHTLLGFAGRNKHGRKGDLQTRALELLRLKSAPIQMKIIELYKARSTQMQTSVPPPPLQPGSAPYQGQQNMAPVLQSYKNVAEMPVTLGTMVNSIPIHPDVRMKRLPFYDIISELIKPSTLMAVGMARIQEHSFTFYLTPAQANEIATNRDIGSGKSEYLVQVQMRFGLLETSCEQEDCFPPGVVLEVNQKPAALPPLIPTNKQGVEPKRLPRPVDISKHVRISPTIANTVSVSWAAEFGRNFVVSINLVRKLTSAQLVHRLKTRGVRHADYTTGLIKEKLREDTDSEIATTSLRVSLLCPLGKVRMTLPCRPTTCSHLQCFDAVLYIQMNERKPTWTCPVCDQPGVYDKLVIDGYFQEVLSSARMLPDANEIELHRDGTWSLSKVEAEKKTNDDSSLTTKYRGGPPVVEATVEIDDDDVIPVESSQKDDKEQPEKPDIKKKTEPSGNASTVDLTLSDDEDDGPPLLTAVNVPAIGETNSSRKAPDLDTLSPTDIIVLDSPSPPSTPIPSTPPLLDPEVEVNLNL